MPKIQLPTPCRMVLYRPAIVQIAAGEKYEPKPIPAMILEHHGDGVCSLGVFAQTYHVVRATYGRGYEQWEYPPMTREEIEVP